MGDDKLPERFVTAIPDDSGGPEYPAGTRIIWSTSKRPSFGSLVLIRDEHGQIHVREYHQGQAPGQWFARPLAPRGFATYDGSMVHIVAVGDEVLRRLP